MLLDEEISDDDDFEEEDEASGMYMGDGYRHERYSLLNNIDFMWVDLVLCQEQFCYLIAKCYTKLIICSS